ESTEAFLKGRHGVTESPLLVELTPTTVSDVAFRQISHLGGRRGTETAQYLIRQSIATLEHYAGQDARTGHRLLGFVCLLKKHFPPPFDQELPVEKLAC